MDAVSAGFQLAKLAAIVAISVAIYHAGGKSTESDLLPVIHERDAQIVKMKADYELVAAKAKGKTDADREKLNIVAKTSEVNNVALQKEVDRRVELYLSSLADAGLRPVDAKSKDGVRGDRNDSGSLSDTAAAYSCPGESGARLAEGMAVFERAAIKQILHKRDQAITDLIICRDYNRNLEKEMVPLREKYSSEAK